MWRMVRIIFFKFFFLIIEYIMPKRYVSRRPRYRRKSGKKGYRRTSRRIKGRVPTTLVQRAPTGQPFPQRFITKLRYVSDAINVVTGSCYDRVIRGNNLYDPDFTGTGHQPMGFDQFATLYNTYRVLGAKITARLVPRDATAGSQNIFFGLIPNLSSTSLSSSTYSALREQPFSKFNFRTLYQGSSTIKKYISTSQIEGVRKSVVRADDKYASLTTTGPTMEWYWHVVCGTMDGSSTNNFTMYFEVDYYVAFEGRAALAQS